MDDKTLKLLYKKVRRHKLTFIVRCDLLDLDDRTGLGWAATISAPARTFVVGLLSLRPHSAGGRKFCAGLKKGDLVAYRLGVNVFEARVAANGDASGLWVHAVDVARHSIMPAFVPDEDDLRWADTIRKHA